MRWEEVFQCVNMEAQYGKDEVESQRLGTFWYKQVFSVAKCDLFEIWSGVFVKSWLLEA